MSRSPSTVTPTRGVDRPVANGSAVADLDVDRVNEQHRVHRVERPALPFGQPLEDPVGDARHHVVGHVRPVDLGQVSRHLASRQPLGHQRDDQVVHAGHAPLPLADDLRFEGSVAVPGHVDLHRADLGQHRLGPGAVAGVPAIAARRLVRLIAQLLGELRLQSCLQHRLGQPRQQPARPDQVHALGLGPLHQPTGDLLLLRARARHHRRRRIGHRLSFPAKPHPGVQPSRPGQLHR